MSEERQISLQNFGAKIRTEYDEINQSLAIKIIGEFNFKLQEDFRKCYEAFMNYELKQVFLDFQECSYIDSSGLGMMLILQEENSFKTANIVIRYANEQIRDLFEMSKFSRFGIEIL